MPRQAQQHGQAGGSLPGWEGKAPARWGGLAAPQQLLPRSAWGRAGTGLAGTAAAAAAASPGLSRAGLSNLKAIKAIISASSGLAPGCREAATTDHALDAAGPRTRLSPRLLPPAPAPWGSTPQSTSIGHPGEHPAGVWPWDGAAPVPTKLPAQWGRGTALPSQRHPAPATNRHGGFSARFSHALAAGLGVPRGWQRGGCSWGAGRGLGFLQSLPRTPSCWGTPPRWWDRRGGGGSPGGLGEAPKGQGWHRAPPAAPWHPQRRGATGSPPPRAEQLSRSLLVRKLNIVLRHIFCFFTCEIFLSEPVNVQISSGGLSYVF